jgi:hypothetical protein
LVFWESCKHGGNIEMTMGDGRLSRRFDDTRWPGRMGCNEFRDLAKRNGRSGGGVQNAMRPMSDAQLRQHRNIVERDMIALFLATAEQDYILASRSLATKSVRSIAVVRVARAIDQRRA